MFFEVDKVGSVGEINKITSIYGREDFLQYVKANLKSNNTIAINIKKASKMLLSIGVDFPEENTFIGFDSSIAYTTENVNYPNAKKSNEKEKDDMAAKKNSFNDFQQRDYDFAALEEKLLAKEEDAIKRADEAYREQALALMEKYGYEEAYVEGFSNDGFNFIQPIGKSDPRGFDGWKMIKEHFEKIATAIPPALDGGLRLPK